MGSLYIHPLSIHCEYLFGHCLTRLMLSIEPNWQAFQTPGGHDHKKIFAAFTQAVRVVIPQSQVFPAHIPLLFRCRLRGIQRWEAALQPLVLIREGVLGFTVKIGDCLLVLIERKYYLACNTS